MRIRYHRLAAASIAVLATAAVTARLAPDGDAGRRALEAGALQALSDLDQDGLPDMLEFVTHSDPAVADTDGDGRNDFVELLEWTSPTSHDPAGSRPNGFRVLLNTTEEGPANAHVLWLHFLFRFRLGDQRDLGALALFVDVQGTSLLLNPLLAAGVAEHHEMRDNRNGLLVRTTLKLPLPASFPAFAPLTFGGYALIGNELYKAGSVLFHGTDISDVYYTVLPVASALVFQTTSPTTRNPFWASNKRCVFKLQVLGMGRAGQICEVTEAKCETSNSRRCPPSCGGMMGQTFFVPDGLALILGG